jgi:TPR repeat protein
MRGLTTCLFVFALSFSAAASQTQSKPLSNADVIQMVSLGLSDDVIVEKIRSVAATNFDTSVAGLKSLKAAKVGDAVLKAMINPHGASAEKESGKSQPDDATADNGFAENNTGYMYLQGTGVAQDYQQALVWFRKAADKHNNPAAEQNLGWMYENGLGVAQDYQQAMSWYRKAAEQGLVGGQCALAWMYKHGLGVAQDYQQAATWYRKAAERSNFNAEDQPALLLAENQLGMLYKDGGNGLPRDDQQAAMWFRKAADQGDPESELNLGWMYANGRGVAQDYQQAISLYRKAANQGKDVQPYLDELPSSVREGAGQPTPTAEVAIVAPSVSSTTAGAQQAPGRDALPATRVDEPSATGDDFLVLSTSQRSGTTQVWNKTLTTTICWVTVSNATALYTAYLDVGAFSGCTLLPVRSHLQGGVTADQRYLNFLFTYQHKGKTKTRTVSYRITDIQAH